ncbi:MAG: RNA methyltransferase [bacterium]|nr:RNA methyltransferase [bacterium]MBU1919180.1 RNA methyltransferase [bacterium]
MNTELIQYLKDFITPRRYELINQVLSKRTRHIAVVLENLYQSHNASAVVRSCDCFGVQDIHVIEKENEFAFNKEIALGASRWTTLHVYKAQEKPLEEVLLSLKNKGYSLVATSLRDDTIPINELPIDQKIALCFGTEIEGLSDEFYEQVDYRVKIPMHGFTQSFNVSVSVALCLYELIEKLHHSGINWHLSEQEQEELRLEWMTKSAQNGEKLVERFMLNRSK